MADTVAVMNHGRIEQLGPPAELYENPATTFVANFLGQSNLISGRVVHAGERDIGLEVHGLALRGGRDRARVTDGEVWVGVRPEKVYLAAAGRDPGDDSNNLRDGVVSDVSFIGVSTQYLVRMQWGQELTIFEQNTGARVAFRVGDRVDLHWNPDHTFLLDASQDVTAGVDRVDVA